MLSLSACMQRDLSSHCCAGRVSNIIQQILLGELLCSGGKVKKRTDVKKKKGPITPPFNFRGRFRDINVGIPPGHLASAHTLWLQK